MGNNFRSIAQYCDCLETPWERYQPPQQSQSSHSQQKHSKNSTKSQQNSGVHEDNCTAFKYFCINTDSLERGLPIIHEQELRLLASYIQKAYFTIWFHFFCDFHLNELLFSFKMTNQEQNNFLPPILIRRLLLQTRIQIAYFIILYFAFTQLMKFKQSLFTLRSRTISQPNRPVIYTGQVPSYSRENQNIRNLNNIFRIRGPHSSNSDPQKFLKKKQNNIQKTTSVSSEEQKFKEEIKKLKMKQEKCEAKHDELSEKYNNYQERSQEALLRGDEKIINYYELQKQRCVRLIQENGKMMDRIIADRRELEKKLQKLQAQKI